MLKEKKLVKKELFELENSDLFKFSPYKDFSEEQMEIINNVIDHITMECESGQEIISFDGSPIKKRKLNNSKESILISGGRGTGKSLLIIKIAHMLLKRYMLHEANIAICVPQTSFKPHLKKCLKVLRSTQK